MSMEEINEMRRGIRQIYQQITRLKEEIDAIQHSHIVGSFLKIRPVKKALL